MFALRSGGLRSYLVFGITGGNCPFFHMPKNVRRWWDFDLSSHKSPCQPRGVSVMKYWGKLGGTWGIDHRG